MKKKSFSLYCFMLLMRTLAAQTEQTQWSAVMAGETLCDPVSHGEYFYTLSSDQALNCINYTGSFVWRRNIAKTVNPFLSVSDSGVLFIADSSGMLQAVSSQGIYLWSLWLSEPILYAPYSTMDGRVCVLTKSNLYCLSMRGKIKWQMKLPAPPASQICETGAASLICVLANKDFLTVALTGEPISRRTLKKEITALAPAPEGYLMSTQDGLLTYYRSGIAGSAEDTADHAVWQIQDAPPLVMKNMGKECLCMYTDGTISSRNISSGALNWKAKLGNGISLPLYCIKKDGQYYLSCKGFAAIIDETGAVKREKTISASPFLPLITPSGILIAVEDWVVNSWRLEEKIMQNAAFQQEETPPKRYRILEIREQAQTLPFYIPNDDTTALLAHIEKTIMQGTAGAQEAAYAYVLKIIFMNTQKAVYYPYHFTNYERAKAAELLGYLESLEYRGILLDEAKKTTEPILAAAIIRALGFIASDPDGKSIETIQLLLRRCGAHFSEPAYAACDTFAEIAKYGDKNTAEAAMKALFTIVSSAFPENIKQYARQKIKTIVE